jgi:hypothetical protein
MQTLEGWSPIAAHDKNTYEHFLGRSKLGAYFVFRWDGEKYISIPTGMFVMPDEFFSLKGVGVGRTEAAIRAEARREALEEAAKVCDGWAESHGRGAPIQFTPAREFATDAVNDCADNIRALIGKEPTDG